MPVVLRLCNIVYNPFLLYSLPSLFLLALELLRLCCKEISIRSKEADNCAYPLLFSSSSVHPSLLL
jgi:hypothetical protein